jgi:hypothetical protein
MHMFLQKILKFKFNVKYQDQGTKAFCFDLHFCFLHKTVNNHYYCSEGKTVCLTSIRVTRQGGKGGGVGRVEVKEAYTVQTIKIISQWQYFVAQCLR